MLAVAQGIPRHSLKNDRVKRREGDGKEMLAPIRNYPEIGAMTTAILSETSFLT